MIGQKLTLAHVLLVTLLSVVCLVYVYAFPPQSMFSDREGVPHFTPPVMHPETGEPVNLGDLIKHFRGD